MYIVTEGIIICKLPQEKIVDTVIGLLGCFIYSMYHTPNAKQS